MGFKLSSGSRIIRAPRFRLRYALVAIVVAVALGAVVVAIGIERLRAAAHWPSDIAAGTALGVLIGGALGRL